MKYVYLAGPIEGCEDEEINGWRERCQEDFVDGIRGINPFRAEELGEYNAETKKRIITKNYMDATSCDGTLAYMPKAINERRPSYGTTFEIAWAFALQKPCWIVTDDEYIINHPLMNHSSMIFLSMGEATDHINMLYEVYL